MSETEPLGGLQSVGAVRQKLKQVAYRHLKNLLRKGLNESSANCAHNGTAEIPVGTFGVCIHPEAPGDRLCEVRLNPERAADCPLFQPRRTKDEIKEDFRQFLATAKLHEIAVEYPDVAALIWVLQGEAPDREVLREEWELGREAEVEINGIRLQAETSEAAVQAREFLTDLVVRAGATQTETPPVPPEESPPSVMLPPLVPPSAVVEVVAGKEPGVQP